MEEGATLRGRGGRRGKSRVTSPAVARAESPSFTHTQKHSPSSVVANPAISLASGACPHCPPPAASAQGERLLWGGRGQGGGIKH